ncbi:hypothetical protein T02_1452 [Trichinella nativa]|uniref:Uncharacterized protein n=1 Tax=Trichinella nativa TaxID=6335 RepID=A0A0V1KLF6_9BILA|nr:hypothetical protein T02_1452 [Trichinella nativa]
MLSYQTWALSKATISCSRNSFQMIVGERGAANEEWRFQCDDRRRRPLKTALYRRIEDKRRHHKDKAKDH